MSRLGPTGLTQLLTDIKTWITTKLGNYVTTDTTQTVTGKKLFTASAIQLDNVTSMSGSTMFIDTSASAPRGAFPAEDHRVGRIYIGDSTSYNGAWFIVDPIINTNKAVYRMVTTNPDNTDSTRFSIVWDSTKEGVRRRKNVSQGDLLPSGASTYNLGELGNAWQDAYINKIHGISDFANITSVTLNANTTLTHAVHGRRIIVVTGTRTLTLPAPENGSWFLIKALDYTVTINPPAGTTITSYPDNAQSIIIKAGEIVLLTYNGETEYCCVYTTGNSTALVGRTDSAPSEPKNWFRVASCVCKTTYSDPTISFKVYISHSGSTIGTLTAHCRVEGTVGVTNTASTFLQWQECGKDITLDNYALTTKDVSGTSVTIELWCKLEGGYSSAKFVRIIEHDITNNINKPVWLLTPNRQTDGDLAELSDTDFTNIVYSTLTTLKNDTTGKAGAANKVQATIAVGATTALVQATVASNDCFRIAAGGAANAGWAEIATGDDANEPIYVRQYKGAFTTLQRTATLLDGSGNTSFPGTVTATTFSGALTGNVTGNCSGSSGSCTGNAATATQFSANTTVALTGDATGTSAGSKKGWSVPVTLANSGVTAGTYGPSEDVTGNNNTTISVPQITVDAKGRVTSVTNRTYTSVNTDTNTDTKVTQTVTNDNACYPLLIANTASASHTGLEPTTETDEVRKAYNINVQARYGFIYARNSYTHDNLKGSVAGGNRTSAAFYGSTYDGAIVGGVELGRVDKYGNRYSRLYATNYITDGALAPDGTAVATTFDVGVLADGTKYLTTSAGWYCNVYPTANNTRTLGTSSLRWKECYSNAYYLGTTAFGDIVTHNASEFLTSHQSLSSCVKNNVTNNQTIKSTAITRGTAPSSAQTFGIAFSDNNNKYIGNIYGQYATDKSTYVGLYAYKGTTTSNGDNAYVRVGYDASGNVYTSAPTPATTDNSTQIATTAFVKAQGYLTSHPSITLSTNTTSTASPAHGGTFTCIDSVTQDTNGHITKVNTKTITLPSDNNTDTKVTQTVTTGNSTYPVLLCATANATETGTTTSRFSAGLTVNTRYSSIYMTNKYDTANTKGVRNTSSSPTNGVLYFRSYDATQMGTIRCESSKNGYQQIYMMANNYIKNGAIDPEGTNTTCYITVRVRDNGSRTIYTDGSWENSLIPYANNTHSLGTSSLRWKNAYINNLILNGNAFDPTSTDGIGTTRLLAYEPVSTTDISNPAGTTKSGSRLYDVRMTLPNTSGSDGIIFGNAYQGEFHVWIDTGRTQSGTWKVLHDISVSLPSPGLHSFVIAMWVRIA